MIPFANLIPGSESDAGDGGSTGALRCTLELPSGEQVAGFIKRGPAGHVAAEAFCAVLLRAWGLPVPDPYLVQEPHGLAFASADAGYPSIKKRLRLLDLPAGPARAAAEQLAIEITASLPTAPLAATADEAIANRDRNLGNILWDGAAEAWIDHAYALGNGQHLPDFNLLCVMAQRSSRSEAFQASAVSGALTLNREEPAAAHGALPHSLAHHVDATHISTRLVTLANAMVRRFPQPNDLLSGV